MKNPFLIQTANDYDIPYRDVEWIYNKWNDKGLFYEKLEEHIRDEQEFENYMLSTLPVYTEEEQQKEYESMMKAADFIMRTGMTPNLDFPDDN